MKQIAKLPSVPKLLPFIYAVLIFLCSGMPPAYATFDPVNDDTDIFLANPNTPGIRPNVLIVLDNTANWNRNVGGQAISINELSALASVVENLGDEFNVGLALFTDNRSSDNTNNTNNGYIRFGIRQMTDTNKALLAAQIAGLTSGGSSDQGTNNVLGLMMMQAYRYFAGKTNYNGWGWYKGDYNSNSNNTAYAHSLGNYPLAANPTSSSQYTSPIEDGCQDNFIIYISNGPANENGNDLSDVQTELTNLGYDTSSTISLTPDGQKKSWMDEFADYMANADVNDDYDGDQHVYTYTVEVDPYTTGQGDDMTALLKSTANKGKGKYFAVSSTSSGSGITNALNQIFQEVQAVNSVFASTTLPVSVNVRGTNLNQVYIGVFRPDSTKSPRWYGNLKAYQLGFDQTTSTLFLADSQGTSAENVTTGFINPDAESFWTSSSSFWSFRPAEQNGSGGSSDLPDGDLVEKGGAAEVLRKDYPTDQSTRKLYTCTPAGVTSPACIAGSSLSATPFDTTNDYITDANLGLGTTAISTLTALDTQTLEDLTDTRAVTALTTADSAPVAIDDLDNGATTYTLSSLSTSAAKTITAMTNSPVYQTISDAKRDNPTKTNATITVNNHGYSTGQVVHISGVGASDFNGTWTITVIDANNFRITKSSDFSSANPSITGAQVATTSTVVTVTVPSHGFTSGNQVTIAGVTPSDFNGTHTITSTPDSDTFRFVTASSLAPITAFGTASSGGTIATATTSGLPGTFIAGSKFTLTGATPVGYNGTYTVLTTDSSTTFTFNAGNDLGTATAPGSISVGSTTVTATVNGGHGLSGGETITISGAVPNGYNGTVTATYVDANTFTYTTISGTAPTAWDSSSTPSFSTGASTTVTATIENHGFGAPGDVVSIDVDGADDNLNTPSLDYNGTGISATVVDANTLTYATQNGGTPDPATGTITAWLSSPTAIATITGHGFSDGDSVTIAGSSVSEFNGTFTITVIDANTFQYTVTSLGYPFGDDTNIGTTTASIKTTTAKARVVGHGLSDGDTVTITGASPGTFNGSFTVSVLPGDTDNFTYTIPSPEGDATVAGNASTGAAAAVADDVIEWVRGADNKDDENNDGSNNDIRASIHGDVLHSRPAVVNYNRFGNDNDVYIFYGSNDGIFRAVKGGFAQADAGEPEPGEEAWGFIPEEHFTQLARLRNNEPIISSSNKKPYFSDGSIGVYVNDANDDGILDPTNSDSGDKVYLYISMHRGGRFIYALDVSDPSDPKFLWKKSSSDWPELGETWSTPFVTTINAQSDPVLIFGAGYDPLVEDVDPATITAFNVDDDSDGNKEIEAGAASYERSMGRGIFVVDAFTGDLIFQAGPSVVDKSAATDSLNVSGMDCSMPGDAAVITDRAGSVDNRAYFGDTCANIWRLDMDDADPGNWTVTKLADLNDETDIPAGLRKFLFPPDVVYGDNFDAVLIGSGDREHPFDEDVQNRFYMIRDLGTSTTAATTNITEATLFDATSNCLQSSSSCSGTGDEIDQITAAAALDAGDGWYITLGAGEKVVGNAVTLNNVTFFNTNQPGSDASCTANLGIARQYQVNYDDATAYKDKNLDGNVDAADRSVVHPGGGYLPSPVPVVVEIDGEVHEGVISGVKVDQPPGSLLGARLRKFWFKEFE